VLVPRAWTAGAHPGDLGPAIAAQLDNELVAAGWAAVGDASLLDDGSLRASAFRRGDCTLRFAVLPRDPVLAEVAKAGLGPGVRFAWDGTVHSRPPGSAERLDLVYRQMRWRLGLGSRPEAMMVALAVVGDPGCAG
jgi:hypothetical protein